MPFLPLLLFIAVPAIEIMLFIEVGGLIGGWPTVGLTFLTAAGGLAVVKIQGLSVLESARHRIEQGDVPVLEVLDGVCLALAGILLIMPGFFTDGVGALFLIPTTRRALGVVLVARMWFSGRNTGPGGRGGFVEGDFEDVTTAENPGRLGGVGRDTPGPDR